MIILIPLLFSSAKRNNNANGIYAVISHIYVYIYIYIYMYVTLVDTCERGQGPGGRTIARVIGKSF